MLKDFAALAIMLGCALALISASHQVETILTTPATTHAATTHAATVAVR